MAARDLAPNLVELFTSSAARGAGDPFLFAKREGVWQPWPWRRVADEVAALARALRAAGIGPGDRVVIVSENRPEWAILDLAILAAGAVTVPAYTTNTTADYAYLIGHSEARGVVVSGPRLAERLLPALREVGGRRLLLTIDPVPGSEDAAGQVMNYGDALRLGADQPADLPSPASDDVACLIYTSGTGGRPKGVMLTHRNILANVDSALRVLERIGLGDDVFLSFLPLSHAYEHTVGHFLPIATGARIYYAEGIESLNSNLVEARPTIMACVPRLYEVMRQRILNAVGRQRGLNQWLFHKALELGIRRYERPNSLGVAERMMDRALDHLVRRQVRARFGGRMKALVSGGAPLNYDVGLFFTALGLPLFQGYGQTECSPVMSVNLPEKVKLHTVGPAVPGLEIRIAADGEILARGEAVMKGYWKDEAATAEALRGGWLHTGDVGVIDQDGYIQITDRKRDLIVNSGGDNVAPQRIEGILALEREIGQVIVYGDRRPHLVALIVPDQDFLREFARRHRPRLDPAEAARHPDLRRAIGDAVKRANASLSTIERIRRFEILPEPFSIESGLMTPTMKLKRQRIYQIYEAQLQALYA